MTVRKPLLYYFTASFPYGLGELWKVNELEALVEGFDRILIAPFTFAGIRRPRPVPERCEVLPPLLPELSGLRRKLPLLLTGGRWGFYRQELLRSRAYRRKAWLVAWAIASVEIELAMRSPQVRELLRQPRDSVIYFFWAREWAYIAPHLRRRGFTNLFARFHGYDLYAERADNSGYIPFRKPLIGSLEGAILLSNGAREYLEVRHPEAKGKTAVIPLGVRVGGLAEPSKDGRLHIVSCSRAAPVKRLHLIIEALRLACRPIRWTHIGDGPLLTDLQGMAAKLPDDVDVEFIGALTPAEVQPFYAGRAFDLFVNVSEAEGLPVSLMEAMAAGIPVVATNVGGTAELVCESTGILLPANLEPVRLNAAFEQFERLAPAKKFAMRQAARALVQERYDAADNARKLLSLLTDDREGSVS